MNFHPITNLTKSFITFVTPLGGLIFAKQMRAAGFMTLLDPLEQKYGKLMGILLYLPEQVGEITYMAIIFSALGEILLII